jgi:hypothetical protein
MLSHCQHLWFWFARLAPGIRWGGFDNGRIDCLVRTDPVTYNNPVIFLDLHHVKSIACRCNLAQNFSFTHNRELGIDSSIEKEKVCTNPDLVVLVYKIGYQPPSYLTKIVYSTLSSNQNRLTRGGRFCRLGLGVRKTFFLQQNKYLSLGGSDTSSRGQYSIGRQLGCALSIPQWVLV